MLLIVVAGIGVYSRSNLTPYRVSPYFQVALAQTARPNGSGFLWTDTGGWISMNCRNDWDGDGEVEDRCAAQGTYGVSVEIDDVTLDGMLSGYAWSPNLGLICFGETCGACPDVARCSGQTVGSNVLAAFDMDDMQAVIGGQGPDGQPITRRVAFIQGFARVLAQAREEEGWIRLNGTAPGGVPIQLGAWLDRGAITIAGSGWQQNPDRTGVGWVYFGNAPPGNAWCANRTCSASCEPARDPSCQVTLRPEQETACTDVSNGPCCANNQDDDRDENYSEQRDEFATTGVDCLDYDCRGERFYSTTYNPETWNPISDYRRCGEVPEAGNRENALAPADCFDRHDNDLDGTIDCADPDCATAIFGNQRCVRKELDENVYNGCYDGIDNDGNGNAEVACGRVGSNCDCDDLDCNNAVNGFVLCPVRAAICLCAGHERATGLGLASCGRAQDPDGDNVRTLGMDGRACDNCSRDFNPEQEDTDADGVQGRPGDGQGGDACDPVAWLETREGSLYAQLLTGTPPPPGASTATYCILTARDENGTSVQLGQFRMRECASLPNIGVTRFRIIPGERAITLITGDDANPVRAYLDLRPLQPPAREVINLSDQEAERIYKALREARATRFYHQGDLLINEPIIFPAGRGGVTILVDGNLEFGPNAKLSYAREVASARLSELTSVAWIVQGNINVNAEVGSGARISGNAVVGEDLVGTFLATGRISTGTRALATDKALTIRGLVIAKDFKLERQFTSLERGSELVIYDGRAVLNPPPGLADLVKALPTFRKVAASP